MKLEFKKLIDGAHIPTRGSSNAAGYDLYVPETADDIVINPKETVKIGTGIAMAIPENFFGAIFARSGLATKHGLRPANCVGVVDSDYRGEIIVAIHNDSETTSIIEAGTRIAQLVILPYLAVEFVEVDDLNKTERGEGGFGSTGMYTTDTHVFSPETFENESGKFVPDWTYNPTVTNPSGTYSASADLPLMA